MLGEAPRTLAEVATERLPAMHLDDLLIAGGMGAYTPAPVVSMSWAGVNSENLASIWLLYHLTDRLDGDASLIVVAVDDRQRGEGSLALLRLR